MKTERFFPFEYKIREILTVKNPSAAITF